MSLAQAERRILVTGANGFLGRHVTSCAAGAGYEVWSLSRSPRGERAIDGDMTQPGSWQERIRRLQPIAVIHLAGLARSDDADRLSAVHCAGTENLLAALSGTEVWVGISSTGAVYGEASENSLPWRETSRCRPLGAYAESKYKQEQLAKAATKKDPGIRLAIARVANVIGPGQSEEFFLGRLVKQLARLRRTDGETVVLETGPLSGSRDFVDVRDAAAAIVAMLQHGVVGVLNVASGREVMLRDVVEKCLEVFGEPIETRERDVVTSSPIQRQVLDITAIAEAASWWPEYSLEDSIADMVRWALDDASKEPEGGWRRGRPLFLEH